MRRCLALNNIPPANESQVRADSNPAAVRLYQKFGFVEAGRRKRYYAPSQEGGGGGGGEREDALILSRGAIGQDEAAAWRCTEWGIACLDVSE
jgi:hypothetical protein